MLKKTALFAVMVLLTLSFAVSPAMGQAAEDDFFLYSAPGFPEEYRDLIRIVPEGAYDAEKTMDLKSVPYGDHGMGPDGVLIDALFDAGVFSPPEKDSDFPEWENNPDAQQAPACEVARVFEQTFGPGSFSDFTRKDYFSNYQDHFFYREASDSYEYIRRSSGGGIDNARVYVAFERIETQGDAVFLYVRYASYSNLPMGDDDRFRLYADARMRVSGRHEPCFSVEDPGYYLDFVADGGLNEALPVYKHTFRDNGAGGYYWESTAMVQQENAERIKEILDEAKNTAQSSADSSENNSTADSVTDHGTDSSSVGNTSDKERDILIPIWVCIGAAAVALVCMLVPVLINKKKGKE